MPPQSTLPDLLHERLDLVDSKKDHDHGQYGAYAVLHNGRRISACLTLAVICDGDTLATIEGLAEGDRLHPLQQAFIHHDAFQYGYCTPGQICPALSLASEGRTRSRAEIRESMGGSLCHCGAYGNILNAVEDALPLLDRDGRGEQHA